MRALEPDVIEILDRYVKGAVTEKESRDVQELLKSRPECREYHDFLVHFQGVMKQEQLDAPPWLKSKILNQITQPQLKNLASKWAPWGALAAGALLVVIALSYRWNDVQTVLSHLLSGGLAIFNLK